MLNKKAVLWHRWPRDAPYIWVTVCPENFRDSLTMPTSILFTHFWWPFVLIDSMSARTKFKVRSFTRSWDNRGCPRNFSLHPRSLFAQVFNGLLFGGTPWNWMYVPNLKTVALPVPEIIGRSKKIPAVPVYVTLTIPKLESLICILPLTLCVYLRWNVYDGLREFCLFVQEWRFGR